MDCFNSIYRFILRNMQTLPMKMLEPTKPHSKMGHPLVLSHFLTLLHSTLPSYQALIDLGDSFPYLKQEFLTQTPDILTFHQCSSHISLSLCNMYHLKLDNTTNHFKFHLSRNPSQTILQGQPYELLI